MKIKVGRTGLAVMLILSAGFVIFIFAGALNSDRASVASNNEVITVASWDFPEEITFAGETVPLTNFDTRESLDREVNATAYRHGSTLLTIKRAGRYFPEIEKILKENNIPDDFKYLACAESDLANVISPAGATGFWQIMEGTGREYGMTINKEIDERYCIEKSTRFACAFFRKAYEKYGSWTMAAAAYNNGISGLDEQVEIQKETSYYNLLLNDETGRYLFRILALKLIISDPASFGFLISDKDIYKPIPYTEVSVDTTVASFEQFSRKYDTNYKILKYLNPWLRKPYLTNSTGSVFKIRIPEKGVRETLGK
jgi:membrane-bound lytic murein transglycosylase D